MARMWSSSAPRDSSGQRPFPQDWQKLSWFGRKREKVLYCCWMMSCRNWTASGRNTSWKALRACRHFSLVPALRMLSAVIWAGKTCFMWKTEKSARNDLSVWWQGDFLMFRFVIKHLGKFSANLLLLWMAVCPRQKEFLFFYPKSIIKVRSHWK